MLRYILKRFLLVIPVLLGATLLVYTIMEFTPGEADSRRRGVG